MMILWNTVETGFKQILAHKFRSLLTMLGIILGVSSLVAMSALVQGMENGLREALVAYGGLERIRIEQQEDLPVYQRHLADRAPGLTLKDIYALKNNAPLMSHITPFIDIRGYRGGGIYVNRAGKYARPWIISGTWPDAMVHYEHVIEHGRMFNDVDNELARNVCVIGTGIRDDLFGSPEETGEPVNPVGEIIRLNQQPFTIIGMFQHYESEEARRRRLEREAEQELKGKGVERSRGWGDDHYVFRMKNNMLLMPLNTLVINFRSDAEDAVLSGRANLTSLNMKIPDVDLLESAIVQARNVLMMTHNGIEDFSFRTQEDWADEITQSISEFRVSRNFIATISMIIGGIGIMNIMLASISERIREIGIRKSVGATTGDIFVQILIESLVLAVLGGFAGLIAAFGLVRVIAGLTPTENSPVITVAAMVLAFGCSVGVGVVAGLFPAIKASRLHPIQALRHD